MRSVALFLPFLAAASAGDAQSEPAAGTPAPPASVIGLATVADALSALRARTGVQIEVTKPDAWTIVNEPGGVQWSFTPGTHSAYPAVVRRIIKVASDGGVSIEMNALCQAEKA